MGYFDREEIEEMSQTFIRHEQAKTQYKRHHGIICMFDILGVRHLKGGDASGIFIQKFEKLKEFLDSIVFTQKSINRFEIFETITYYILGDTIILAITMKDGFEVNDDAIAELMIPLSQIMQVSIQEKIPCRGAVSKGNFTVSYDTRTLVGEAISDAAHWHERADWIGIVLTPDTGANFRARSHGFGGLTFLKYNVPLSASKGGGTKELCALTWPMIFLPGHSTEFGITYSYPYTSMNFGKQGEIDTNSTNVKNALKRFILPMPEHAKSKLNHTLQFIDYVWEKMQSSDFILFGKE